MKRYSEFIDEVWASCTSEEFIYGKELLDFFVSCNLKQKNSAISNEKLSEIENFIRGKQYLKIYKDSLAALYKDITGESLQYTLGMPETIGNRDDIPEEKQETGLYPPITLPKLRSPLGATSNYKLGSSSKLRSDSSESNDMFTRTHYRRPSGSRISSAGSSIVSRATSSESSSKHRRTTSLPFLKTANLTNSPPSYVGHSPGPDGLKSYTLDKRRISPSAALKSVGERDMRLKHKLQDQQKVIDSMSEENMSLSEKYKDLQDQYTYLSKEFQLLKMQYSSNSSLSEKLNKQSILIQKLQENFDPSSVNQSQNKKKPIAYTFSLYTLLALVLVVAFFISYLYFQIRDSPLYSQPFRTTAALLNNGTELVDEVTFKTAQLKWFENYPILSKMYWSFYDWFSTQYQPPKDQTLQKIYYEKLFGFH